MFNGVPFFLATGILPQYEPFNNQLQSREQYGPKANDVDQNKVVKFWFEIENTLFSAFHIVGPYRSRDCTACPPRIPL